MQVINFLENQNIWLLADVFAPIAGQKVHGQILGSSSKEIIEQLKLQFNLNENVQLPKKGQVTKVLDTAESILAKHFDLKGSTIYIAGIDDSEDFANKNLGGVSGYAWPNAILLYFNPERDWAGLLLRTALHEFNHCQRYRFSDPYQSLLDWLIFEGLAQSFEVEMTKQTFSFEKNKELAQKYIPQLSQFWNEFPQDGYQWFFGDENRSIPVGLGYSVGQYLVERYRKSSINMSWQELIKIPSSEFVTDLTDC